MSSTPFFESGDFTYTAHVRRLEVPKGAIHVGITTRWELKKLIAALQSGLSDNA